MPSFQMTGIAPEPFAPLFELTDAELARLGARRVIADDTPGFPCRITLEDAEVGDELLLLPHEHQAGNSPYRASGPIYVRRGVPQRVFAAGEVPASVTRRLISVRGYDAAHLMIQAEVCEGSAVRAQIERQFGDDRVAYIHLHYARRGCFACKVERA